MVCIHSSKYEFNAANGITLETFLIHVVWCLTFLNARRKKDFLIKTYLSWWTSGEIIAPNPFKGHALFVHAYSLGQSLLTDVLQAGSLEGLAVVAADSAALLWSRGPLQPSVPQVCCFAEMADPVQSVVLLLFSSNSHLKLVWGPLWQNFFCLAAPWAVSLRDPGESASPWQRLAISLIPDGSGLEPEAGGQSTQLPNWLNYGKPPLASWKWPHHVSLQLFEAVLWWLPAQVKGGADGSSESSRHGGSSEGQEAAAGQGSFSEAQPQLGKGRAPRQELPVPWLLPSRIVWCCWDSVWCTFCCCFTWSLR